MPISEELINDIKKHADIVDVIKTYLPVTQRGKNFLAVCPFHDDSNPSLTISKEKQIFKCFVCGTSGNAITFVQKYEHISFIEAVKKVAEISGYHSDELNNYQNNKPVDEKKSQQLKCLHDLTLFYEYALNTPEGKEGLDYFESRHLDNDLRKKYQLGYALKDGQATIQFLQNKGHSIKTIEDVGISIMKGKNFIDRNEGRVIFPICDNEGNVVGYSARRLKDDDSAKYVNTQGTYLFNKSSILYNYHIAKESAKLKGYIYICEGFMDVFALSRIGVDSCVATMGTALTKEHVEMLRHLNVEVRICLDGDNPGQEATMKAATMLSKAGLKFSVVNAENNLKDPDEILNEDGPEALKNYINNLFNGVDYTLSYYMRIHPPKSSAEKEKLIHGFLPILSSLRSEIEVDSYIRKLSSITNYDQNSIRSILNKYRNKDEQTNIAKVIETYQPEKKVLMRLKLAEREFLYQMMSNKPAIAFYEHKIGGFYDDLYRQIANFIVDYSSKNENIDVSGLITSLQLSTLENKDELINQLTELSFEKTHPDMCNENLLEGLLATINEEKERIFDEDSLKQSLEGKDPLEKARIMRDFNHRKMKNR